MNILNGFEIMEHPSDIGIRAYSEKPEGLFENFAKGMFSIMCRIENVKPAVRKEIKILRRSMLTLEDLLIIWLEKLLYIYEVEEMLFSLFKVPGLKIKDDVSYLYAEAYGEKVDLERHELFVSIKAPTYHRLEIKKGEADNLWVGQIIFDV